MDVLRGLLASWVVLHHIVLASGFQTNEILDGVEIVGRGGETLQQHCEAFGGPEAYNCAALSGFPNFFLLLGKPLFLNPPEESHG